MWGDLKNVDALQFNLKGSLGEYDGDAGEFPVKLFNPGTYIQGPVPIYFGNPSDVRIFPVAPKDGRETIEKFGVARSATMFITLIDLKPSATRSNALEGDVSEVVFMKRDGTEIASYGPRETENESSDASSMDPDALAASLGETLNVPVASSPWADVLPFLKEQAYVSGTGGNFSGELFSFEAGEFKTQRPLDQYSNLTIGFGPSENAAKLALNEASRLSFGFDGQPRPFFKLDCMTPDMADQCGIMLFEKVGEHDILVDIMTLSELQGQKYDSQNIQAVFGDGVLSQMDSAETQVGYTEGDVGGMTNRALRAKAYWAGDLIQKRAPLHDLRGGYSETFSAKTMLWLIDGFTDRTIIVTRSSLP